MSIKPPKKENMLGFLDQVDTSLQKITGYLDTIFEDIESCPQATVDYLCENASAVASYCLDYGRTWILNSLGAQKKAAEELAEEYATLSAAMVGATIPPVTLPTLIVWAASMITLIKELYKIVIKPYEEALEFIIDLTEKLIRISENMMKVANYTPPKAPDINFNKFKIKFTPFSISDLGEEIPYPEPPTFSAFPNPFEDSIKLAKQLKKTKMSGGESNTGDIA